MGSYIRIHKFILEKNLIPFSSGERHQNVKILNNPKASNSLWRFPVCDSRMANTLRESSLFQWIVPSFFFFFLSCKLVHVFYEVLMQLVSNVPNLCNWIFHKWGFCMQAFVHINIYASIQINARASV